MNKHIICPICNLTLIAKKFESHFKKKHDYRNYQYLYDTKVKCNICGEMVNKIILKTHKLFFHNIEPKTHGAQARKLIRPSKKPLKQKLKSHLEPIQVSCVICHSTMLVKFLNKHNQKIHKIPSPGNVMCPKCEIFLKQTSLKRHLRKVHAINRKLDKPSKTMVRCYLCDKIYSVNYIEQHKREKHFIFSPDEYYLNWKLTQTIYHFPISKIYHKENLIFLNNLKHLLTIKIDEDDSEEFNPKQIIDLMNKAKLRGYTFTESKYLRVFRGKLMPMTRSQKSKAMLHEEMIEVFNSAGSNAFAKRYESFVRGHSSPIDFSKFNVSDVTWPTKKGKID